MTKEKDIFILGQEPQVESAKIFKLDKLNFGSLRRRQNIKEENSNNIHLKERKCPDPSLYEDLVENLNIRLKVDQNIHLQRFERSQSQDNLDDRPFKRVESCLFSCFTSCAPWCLMRRIYWNK